MKLISAVVLVAVFACASADDSWCRPDLCPAGTKHIACNNPTEQANGEACGPGAELVPIDDKFKALAVKLHNEARAKIASGNLDGFPAAKRMPEVQWDDTLASFAQLNARSCVYAHDKCHNTDVIKNGGQNIAFMSNYEKYADVSEVLKSAITDQWFVEYKLATSDDIVNYCDPNGKILHFLQMTNDKVTKIGCAVMRYPNKDKENFKTSYVVCDYSYGNICGLPTYESGDKCSACTTGCSKKLPGLCGQSEQVDAYNNGIQYF